MNLILKTRNINTRNTRGGKEMLRIIIFVIAAIVICFIQTAIFKESKPTFIQIVTIIAIFELAFKLFEKEK